MPGIYGIINKSVSQARWNEACSLLNHFSFYEKENHSVERGKFGWIGIRDEQKHFYFDSQNHLIIGGHGYVDEYCTNGKFDWKKLSSDYRNTNFYERLSGSFVLFIMDMLENEIVLTTDHMAYGRLYYYYDSEKLIFAPEVKFFRPLLENLQFNEKSMIDFLNYGFPFGNETYYKNIFLLEPGEIIRFRNGKIKKQKLQLDPYQMDMSDRDVDLYVDPYYEVFDQLNTRRLAGVKKVIIPLSGGLDSRMIFAYVHRKKLPMLSISYGIKGSKEVEVARKVAASVGTDAHRVIELKLDSDVERELERTVWVTDGMTNLRCFFVNLFNQQILNEDKTGAFYLNGISGGPGTIANITYELEHLDRNLPDEKKLTILSLVSGGKYFTNPLYRKLFADDFKRKLEDQYWKSIQKHWEKVKKVSPYFGHQLEAFSISSHFYRMSMGIDLNQFYWNESFPYASKEIYNFYRRLPEKIKYKRTLHEAILRKFFPDVAKVENYNTGRNLYNKGKRFHPEKKLSKLIYYLTRVTKGKINLPDKTQYAPFDYWYRSNRKFREFFENILMDPKTNNRGFINRVEVEKLLKMEREGIPLFNYISLLTTLELFHRHHENRKPFTF